MSSPRRDGEEEEEEEEYLDSHVGNARGVSSSSRPIAWACTGASSLSYRAIRDLVTRPERLDPRMSMQMPALCPG